MSAEKHTPGPWKAVKAPHGPIDIIDSRDRDIVTVFGSISDPARQQANARVIAAAPDMLATLKQVAAWLRGGDYDTRGGLIEMDRLAGVCEAAIAKAREA